MLAVTSSEAPKHRMAWGNFPPPYAPFRRAWLR